MRGARCFAEPWWWAALAVLVVNDHVLKGAGILPGWVTGKLSDFAGLLVAPALLVTALRATSRCARAACFAVVALPFAAMNLWPAVAFAVERLGALGGLSWSIWCDPTDVVALAVLVPAWRLCRPGVARVKGPAPSLLERAGLSLGALACLATSTDFREIETAAYLVNGTIESVNVRLSRHPEPEDCSTLDPALGWDPQLEDFAFEKEHTLSPESLLPLDRPFWDPTIADAEQDAGPQPPCAAVLLEVRGLPPTVVFWDKLPRRLVDDRVDPNESLDPQAVYLERAATRLFLTGTEHVRTLQIGALP